VVLCERHAPGKEHPDAIGWTRDGRSIVIECKVNRSDFTEEWRRVERKEFRRTPGQGMGVERYYLAPCGVLDRHEDADMAMGWGFLNFYPGGLTAPQSGSQAFERNLAAEMALLISALACTPLRRKTEKLQLQINFSEARR
jgi:hypothetical protein